MSINKISKQDSSEEKEVIPKYIKNKIKEYVKNIIDGNSSGFIKIKCKDDNIEYIVSVNKEIGKEQNIKGIHKLIEVNEYFHVIIDDEGKKVNISNQDINRFRKV